MGHLVTEGYLRRAEDVLSVSISPSGQTAAVTLAGLSEPGPMPDVLPAQSAVDSLLQIC